MVIDVWEAAIGANGQARLAGGAVAERSLLGRDRELEQLVGALRDARSRALAVTVISEPGMGKTALLDAALARAGNAQVLRATGIEVHSELPFGGLHQLLSSVLPAMTELPERQRAVLGSALAIDTAVTHDQLAVAAAVLALLAAAMGRAPLLLVIDDAQWVDAESIAAVMFAFARMHDQPLALVIASRPQPEPPRPPHHFTEIRLGPLDHASARALAEAHIPEPLDRAAVDRIVALADGVPLAIIELSAAGGVTDSVLRESSGPDGVAGQLISRLFGRRLEQLTEQAGTAALIAALDEPGEHDTFLRAAATFSVSESAWSDLERASIVSFGGGRVDFVHPLLRQAVRDHASPQALRRAHLALAAALTERGDATRAVMHRAAGTLGADEKLADALERAAREHRERAGHAVAARALTQSARLSISADGRARRLLLAADDARRAGQWDWAGSLADEARASSPDQLLRAQAELIHGHIEARRGSMAAALRRYQRVAKQAGDSSPEMAATALAYASSAATVIGDVTVALQAALDAEAISPDELSPDAQIAVQEALGTALALSGNTMRARVILDEVASVYERQPERVGAEYVAEALIWLGDFARVRRLLDDLETDARRLDAPGLLIQTLELRAELKYRTGNWSSGIADATEAVGLAQDAGQTVLLTYALAILAVLQAATGALEAAIDAARRARQGAGDHALAVVDETVRFALAIVELSRGDSASALAVLEPVAAAGKTNGRCQPAMSLWPAELLEALVASDRRTEAERILERLHAEAVQTGGEWATGIVARYRGILAADTAFDEPFSEAIARHTATGMPFELARTQFAFGQRLRRAGRRVEARAQLRAARTTFDALSASTWVTRADKELAGSGARLQRGPSADRDALTPQEWQIARLIGTGATNREAAADLFLSPKTIETHLTHIYRKLAIRSRSQLALQLREDENGVST